ncbi:LacI family DNA-binding transcriptional regulator [Microbacterium sp. NEAU-LLC]|uniref:LacI family DNA-binding transcriptional regulator n=1 Tax=Microbacterium helvum TaxID=2773713 RepID=A0ABR8NRE2_9MICO|nr:LacI family DNA-binding transcriptional regulator [Microbacterium helvum]MBD3943205.1 LacI family DNA-binding transcriptional regulator [Microbacterium helvum]
MVTVHDVAARSGVSIATVSRTLREPHRVSDDTRDRVLAAVDELGYRPNRAASSLRRGRTGVIALVVPDIENPYFASMTKGAQVMCRERGYELVVVDTSERAEIEDEEVRVLRSQIDGLILASSRLSDERLAEVAETTSCVLVNRSLESHAPGTPTVTIDEGAAAALAVAHLYGLGHRRIVYVGGPSRSWSQARRAKGIETAAHERDGLELIQLRDCVPTSDGGREVAEKVLALGPTAVIGYNDLVALGLLAQWTESDIRVPGHVSLIGFDDTFVTGLVTPPLTSVGADLRVVGDAAVELLIERIDGVSTSSHLIHRSIQPQLAVRSSTAPPAARR